jgi:hypothetical protein
MWPTLSDLDEGTLRLGDMLGSGGQGRVRRVTNHPGLVYKQYREPGADSAALKILVDVPAQLPPPERDWLLARTSWPLMRVFSNGRLSGFLMSEIPRQFFAANSVGSTLLRELQFLVYPRKPLWGQIVPPDGASVQTRIEVAREFANLLRMLHGKSLVVGDVSMRNVLWKGMDDGATAIFLVDCDGIRRLGSRPVLTQASTLDWNDPLQPQTGPDLDTDRYKLAVLVGRTLAQAPYLRPGDPLPFVSGVPEPMATRLESLWQCAAGARGTRPNATQWALALRN